MTFSRDLVAPNQLNAGDTLVSAAGNFQLIAQEDGNLVLYAIDDASLPKVGLAGAKYTRVIWASGTNGRGISKCVMQPDGNLVLYDALGGASWNTQTNGNPGAFLRCQCDGNLVIYASNGAILASSNTYAGAH